MDFLSKVQAGERFEFGKNWRNFLYTLSEDGIAESEKALCDFLNVQNLEDKTFLDIGSGSGLSSLAARRLGAHVHSFDYDPQSVECTNTRSPCRISRTFSVFPANG